MKTLIIIIIIPVFFVSGCGGYTNPEITRIQTEWDTMLQKMNELVPVVEDWSERHTQFMAGLTDDQLEAYAEACNLSPGNEAAHILKLRRLGAVLSEDEAQTLLALTVERVRWAPQAQYLINWEKRLRKEFEVLKENARYEAQWRQAQAQTIIMGIYHQQQMQQSLSGIENAIRTQIK